MSTALPYTDELSIPEDGGDDDIWGLLLNALFSAWDRHFGGFAEGDISSADWTLDETEAQCGRIYISGNPGVGRSVILPAKDRTYLVSNFSTAALGCVLLSCGGGGDIAIPNGCTMVITCSSDTGEIVPAGPPFGRDGGFPDQVRRIGTDWQGPGIYFEGDNSAGFGRPVAGAIDVHCNPIVEGASFRFVADETGGSIHFRGAGGFASYLQGLADGRIRLVTGNVQRVEIGAGMALGATNGVSGDGTLNADGYYRKGQPLPVARQYQRTGLSAAPNAFGSFAHGQGSAPLAVLVRLDCVSPDRGYVAGDRITVDGAGGNACIIAGGNATTVFYRVNDTFQLATKTSAGGTGSINPVAWNVVITGVWP